MIKISGAKFISSFAEFRDGDFESELPEFAFVGRSNVGKSSLINSITNHSKLARTSSTPGRTQLINLFEVDFKLEEENVLFNLVDLPGYGYAKTSKSKRIDWDKFVFDYLSSSSRLVSIYLLIDARRKIEDEEVYIINYFSRGKVKVVLTKVDTLKQSEIALQKKLVLNYVDESNLFLVSNFPKKKGIEKLQANIVHEIKAHS